MSNAKGLFIILGILFFSVFFGLVFLKLGTHLNPVPAAEYNWLEYTSPTKSFKVKFPTLPQTTSKVFTDPNTNQKRLYEMHVSQMGDGTVFMVSTITFPEKKANADDDELLAAVASDMITSNPKNVMIKTEKGTFQGHHALTFSLNGDNVKIYVKTFVVGNIIYILTEISPEVLAEHSEYDFFTNSFELISGK